MNDSVGLPLLFPSSTPLIPCSTKITFFVDSWLEGAASWELSHLFQHMLVDKNNFTLSAKKDVCNLLVHAL